ncbi:alpha-galactosidase [Zhihengliuella halotolerans]|uniref:alpha-galactosidase n=1 Tax=Zhihengliuella halotolerans TaxID=370736 RepID=UPI000C80B684|nr:alpha-galactosidase [Zhihengliuella halotolerans]
MDPVHLRAAGTSLLLTFPAGEAEITHFGADLGTDLPDPDLLTPPIPNSALDVPVVVGIIPQASSGWQGRPGLRGSFLAGGRPGRGFSPALRVESVDAAADAVVITAHDSDLGLTLSSHLRVHPGGLLEVAHTLTNTAADPYQLEELAVVIPLPRRAGEVLDLTGRWCRENHPQRARLRQGTWVRSGRHGRTGHDSSLLTAVGTPGFANRAGEVWASHFAWSGNHEQFVEQLPDGRRLLGASELLGSGEIVLESGQSYTTPAFFAAYSNRGLDGVSARFHEWFRAREHHVGTVAGRVRPVVLNTWEAVYFDHRIDELLDLAASGAELGAEQFVLDDGWFAGRRNDTAGLGDWVVDSQLWPEGLTPLIEGVNALGMEFGLWVEPEMVNLDSDVARDHPDWIVGPDPAAHTTGGRLPLEWRSQHILDLTNPGAWSHVFDQLDALLAENNIAYLKWDQNRDLSEHGSAGAPSVHEQTLAAYRLLDELRAAHPGVEIESCSSGGARVDLGILERTDRVWASDCNDALERQTIQRWTQAVLPPELVGSHVGPTRSHTTGRVHDISFRAITALFGHFGMEWDVRQASALERETLARAIALYKEHRALLHSGIRVNADLPDEALRLHGVVSRDGREALFAAVAVASSYAEMPGPVPLPGLDPDASYRVEVLLPSSADADHSHAFTQIRPPAWLRDGDAFTASGAWLEQVGLQLPVLNPEHALLLRAVAL